LVLHPVHLYNFLLALAEDLVFLPDLPEGVEGLLQMVDLVACGDLRADARLSLRYDGEEEPDGVDAFRIEVAG
jgi:hypothetical protein